MRRLILLFLASCSSTPEMGDGSPDTDSGSTSEASDDAAMADDGMSGMDSGAMDSGVVPCTQDMDKTGVVTRMVKGRSYLSYVPSTYKRGTPMPVVLALHGAGDKNANYLNVMWKANADAKGFIVIAPEGTVVAGPGFTWQTGDKAYIEATIPDMEACYDIQAKKVIIHGFSAGGIIAYWLGLRDAKMFSGIAINSADVGSAEAIAQMKLIPAPWTIPVSHFHGDQDMNFPLMYAQAGIDRLNAAGHKTFFHIFQGGHTASPQMAAQEFDDLASSSAP